MRLFEALEIGNFYKTRVKKGYITAIADMMGC